MPEEMRKEALKERRIWLQAFFCEERDVDSDIYGEFIISRFEDGQDHLVRVPWHLNLSTIQSGQNKLPDHINYQFDLVEANI